MKGVTYLLILRLTLILVSIIMTRQVSISEFVKQIQKLFKTDDVNGMLELETPFKNHNGDRITVYIEDRGTDYIITDDGQTINTLSISGLDFDDSKRLMTIFKQMIKHYNIQYNTEYEELNNIVSKDLLAIGLIHYLHALIAIDSIYFLHGKV